MKNLRRRARMSTISAATALFIGAIVQFTPSWSVAGEREEALVLCRSNIAAAYQVTADESGAHFQESQTTARAYSMRFQVRTPDGGVRVATCKVKRGALAVIEISPPGPSLPEKAAQATAPEPNPSVQ
jgi:hypothetical protein